MNKVQKEWRVRGGCGEVKVEEQQEKDEEWGV